jgi:hypothetical protein
MTRLLFLALLLAGCSLGNVRADACASDGACAAVFGAGSRCVDGFCSASAGCKTDKDCKLGKCVAGSCQASGCEGVGKAGQPCFSCPAKTTTELKNACSDTSCVAFDEKSRLTKLKPDGSLPALP